MNLSKLPKNWEYFLALFIAGYFVFVQIVGRTESTEYLKLAKHLTVLSDPDVNDLGRIDNSKYAYVQYATNLVYLNLAILNFITIRESSSKIGNLVILHSEKWRESDEDEEGTFARFEKLKKLASQQGIKLKPVPTITTPDSKHSEWRDSFTKFHLFNQIEYERIVYFDADSMIVNVEQDKVGAKTTDKSSLSLTNKPGNLDELFAIPKDIDIALPQAYWLHNFLPTSAKKEQGKRIRSKTPSASLYYLDHKFENRLNFFANHVMVIKPKQFIFKDLLLYIFNPGWWSLFNRKNVYFGHEFDMEVLNKYIDTKLQKQVKERKSTPETLKIGILNHRKYGVITGEFKKRSHKPFTAEPQDLPFIYDKDYEIKENEVWDALEVIESAKLVHFSDAPVPKPWESKLENNEYYNVERIYCSKDIDVDEFNRKFPVKLHQPRLSSDCNGAFVWEWLRDEFERRREQYWVVKKYVNDKK